MSGRRRILTEHTAAHRAADFERYISEAVGNGTSTVTAAEANQVTADSSAP